MDTHKRRQIVAVLAVVIIAASSFSIYFAYRLTLPYEFKTGVNHPALISNLLKNGPVVIDFSQNGCPPCYEVTPKMADLQSQYSGTNVTFLLLNIDDNATSRNIAQAYGLEWTPREYVIRSDGAVAIFDMKKDPFGDSYHMDFNAIRSAIEEARHS